MRASNRTRRRADRLGSDIDQLKRAHAGGGRHQEMGELPGPQRNGQVIAGKSAVEWQAEVRIDPAGQVDRNQMVVDRGKVGEQRNVFVAERPRQARTEQAIDQDVTGLSLLRRKHSSLVQRARMPRGIGRGIGCGDHRNLAATCPDRLGNHPAIAAIVAGAAQHSDLPPRRQPPDPFRRPSSGTLHQFVNAGAARDQRRFGIAHLLGGEDLVSGTVHRPPP